MDGRARSWTLSELSNLTWGKLEDDGVGSTYLHCSRRSKIGLRERKREEEEEEECGRCFWWAVVGEGGANDEDTQALKVFGSGILLKNIGRKEHRNEELMAELNSVTLD